MGRGVIAGAGAVCGVGLALLASWPEHVSIGGLGGGLHPRPGVVSATPCQHRPSPGIRISMLSPVIPQGPCSPCVTLVFGAQSSPNTCRWPHVCPCVWSAAFTCVLTGLALARPAGHRSICGCRLPSWWAPLRTCRQQPLETRAFRSCCAGVASAKKDTSSSRPPAALSPLGGKRTTVQWTLGFSERIRFSATFPSCGAFPVCGVCARHRGTE